MPRTRHFLALILMAAAFSGGCQQAPRPSTTGRPRPADALAGEAPASQPAFAGGDATAAPAGHHLLTLSGQVGGGNGIVYVIDEDRDLLSAMTYVTQGNRVIHMEPIDLTRVFGTMSAATARYEITGDGRTARGQKYVAILCPLAQGDEALYLVNRAGLLVVYSFDATSQRLEQRTGGSMAEVLK